MSTSANGHGIAGGNALEVDDEPHIGIKTHAALALRHLESEAKALRKALKRNAKAQHEVSAMILALGADRISN